MNDKTIICAFNPFDINQKVQIIDDEHPQGKIMGLAVVDTLGSVISTLCQTQNCYNVHLYGNAQHLIKIINDIHQSAITEYGEDNIIIEVN